MAQRFGRFLDKQLGWRHVLSESWFSSRDPGGWAPVRKRLLKGLTEIFKEILGSFQANGHSHGARLDVGSIEFGK